MDFAAGEKSVWVVEGGKYKASFLLEGAEGERLLISEVSSSFFFKPILGAVVFLGGEQNANAGDA